MHKPIRKLRYEAICRKPIIAIVQRFPEKLFLLEWAMMRVSWGMKRVCARRRLGNRVSQGEVDDLRVDTRSRNRRSLQLDGACRGLPLGRSCRACWVLCSEMRRGLPSEVRCGP